MAMAAPMAAVAVEPEFDIGDRLEKSRRWCGISSASKMADLLSARLGKTVKPSTVSAWENGTNQPTRGIRLDELVRVWVEICNEVGTPSGRATSEAFIYGITTGSFASLLSGLPVPTGQGSLLDTDLEPFDFFSRPQLVPV